MQAGTVTASREKTKPRRHASWHLFILDREHRLVLHGYFFFAAFLAFLAGAFFLAGM
jgi:hypothetical protein